MKSNDVGNTYRLSITKSECVNISATTDSKNLIDTNQETKCYKILEDSGGGGINYKCDNMNKNKEVKHSYMLHGINLRTRLPKPLTISKKLIKKEIAINEEKNKEICSTEKGFISQPLVKSLSVKNKAYKSYMLNSSINHRKKDSYSRKSLTKMRNEILGSIYLKDIINHENLLKLSSDIQWHLVKLLPSCDKPKFSDNLNSCQYCSDQVYPVNEHQQLTPNVSLNALNNEFIGKALTKYAMKMGQSDLINLFTSERENLRSRPASILNDESILINKIEKEIKTEKNEDMDKIKTEDNDTINHSEDIKSNSSICSTDTMEMNGSGNLFENISLKIEENGNSSEIPFDDTCDINYFIERRSNRCDIRDGSLLDDKVSIENIQCDKVNTLETNEDVIELKKSYFVDESLSSDVPKQNLSVNTSNDCHKLGFSEIFNEKRKKRGRKRKCVTTPDVSLAVPVKRPNRSTAGKKPARLNSRSPPTSPNHNPNNDKKCNQTKLKRQKDRNSGNKKLKSKHEHSSDELDIFLKSDVKCKNQFHYHDLPNNSKNCSSSPESLPIESDFSPLSKPSPNGSSLLGSLCRSSLASLYNDKKSTGHVNSVQALSPSWSCTSESTTPSVKSDYGHVLPVTIPSFNNGIQGNIDVTTPIESEPKAIQGMPPPRQTLTLAAMREKMRAKKLAKEDNRKGVTTTTTICKKSSSFSSSRNRKQSNDCLEGDDESQMMDKVMNSSEEFDDILKNNQDSLLEFFMGDDDNYDFETSGDQCNINTTNSKLCNTKRSISKSKIKSEPDCLHSKSDVHSNHTKDNNHHHTKFVSNKSPSSTATNCDSSQLGKSIADSIASVLQRLNSPKENGITAANNSASKTSASNAYLVDGNGLSTALSFIQSLNPGAKVTTQQFYLVNSGPQLFLQSSPSNQEKVSAAHKVSLAPKIARPINDGLAIQFNSNQREKLSPESSLHNANNCLKIAISSESTTKNTFMIPPINTSTSSANISNPVHLQTISTPHPVGLVHSVHPTLQTPLPSLFSSQLRFVHPTSLATNHNSANTISLIGPNIQSANSATNQSPKLLFLCPTVSGTAPSNLVANQNDQKYLLLSKQPDKQATIQLVSSQGLWQQLNPTGISQANNLLLMQQPHINSFDSLLCSSNRSLHGPNSTLEPSSSSLIIDSRSLISKLSSDEQQPTTSVTSLTPSPIKQNLSHIYGCEESTNINVNLHHQHSQDISQS